MDATRVLSSAFPTLGLNQIVEEHPLLHSRLTELQVHTLLGVSFDAHKVWTSDEIRDHLLKAAEKLNPTAVRIYPNQLSDDSCFSHYKGLPSND